MENKKNIQTIELTSKKLKFQLVYATMLMIAGVALMWVSVPLGSIVTAVGLSWCLVVKFEIWVEHG